MKTPLSKSHRLAKVGNHQCSLTRELDVTDFGELVELTTKKTMANQNSECLTFSCRFS